MTADRIEKKFRELFNGTPHLYRSPGRINLIGEHTDYNDGFVLPAAIDLEVIFAIELNSTGKIRVYAFDLGEDHEAEISSLKKDAKKWPDYLAGVVDQLRKAGHPVEGFNCVFGSDIPIGAGLS
jgi:galactokinase